MFLFLLGVGFFMKKSLFLVLLAVVSICKASYQPEANDVAAEVARFTSVSPFSRIVDEKPISPTKSVSARTPLSSIAEDESPLSSIAENKSPSTVTFQDLDRVDGLSGQQEVFGRKAFIKSVQIRSAQLTELKK